MKKNVLTNDLLLMLTSIIWGTAFVAQRVGMDYIGPFTYNAARYVIGPLSLVPLIALRWKSLPAEHRQIRPYLLYGLVAGTVVFTASTLQQIGLVTTTAGNAGFITGFYVVLVPILGYFLGQTIGLFRWIAALLALAGLYFLSITQGLNMGKGDLIVLIGSLFWALHIIVVGRASSRLDSLLFSFVQFALCAVYSIAGAFIFETPTWEGIRFAAVPILYGGIMSVGVAYTLQVVAQKHVPPSHAVIILSMEGAFAALAGALFLAEVLTFRQLFGCVLMLGGMLLSQLAGREKS